MLAKAELYEVIRRLTEWAAVMEVDDYEDTITERNAYGAPSGEMIETLTIRWRRPPPGPATNSVVKGQG
jgi:hypothetical protein